MIKTDIFCWCVSYHPTSSGSVDTFALFGFPPHVTQEKGGDLMFFSREAKIVNPTNHENILCVARSVSIELVLSKPVVARTCSHPDIRPPRLDCFRRVLTLLLAFGVLPADTDRAQWLGRVRVVPCTLLDFNA